MVSSRPMSFDIYVKGNLMGRRLDCDRVRRGGEEKEPLPFFLILIYSDNFTDLPLNMRSALKEEDDDDEQTFFCSCILVLFFVYDSLVFLIRLEQHACVHINEEKIVAATRKMFRFPLRHLLPESLYLFSFSSRRLFGFFFFSCSFCFLVLF